jgi:hypothetical protein
MTSNAKRVAQWWSYKTRHQRDAQHAAILWLESGLHQQSSSMEVVSIQQEGNNVQPKSDT